jgi:hypothetical protein
MSLTETSNTVDNSKAGDLRKRLVDIALEWESYFGVAPSITSVVSEWDAANLVRMKEEVYCAGGQSRTAVTKDTDFTDRGIRYQVTANRPSGKKGSRVTLVSRKSEKMKRGFGWDRLIWILYNRTWEIQEAWEFSAEEYRTYFSNRTRLSPDDMRKGRRLFPPAIDSM